MTRTKSKTATEASAATAISVGAILISDGEPVLGAISLAVGVGLFVAYEVLNLKDISLDEEDLQDISRRIRKGIEDSRDRL